MADARRTATVTPDAWSAPHFAAHPIAVKYSDAKGYHVVATRDVRAGDTLLKTRLYAGAPFKNYRKRVCARCLSACDPALTGLRALPLRCARCDQCYYCSPACAAADVSAGHVRVCSAFRDVLSSGKHDPHVDSMVRTVLQIARACAREHRPLSAEEIDDGIANVHQTPNCRAAPAHAHSGPAVVGSATASGDAECDAHTADNGTWKRETTENVSEAAVAEESGDAEKVGGVEMSDVESLARELRDALSLSLSLAEGGAERENAALPPLSFDDLSQLQSHAASWDKEDCAVYRKIVRALVALRLLGMPADEMGFLHLLSRIECNGFGVWGRKEEYMGRALYPAASFFNHSCRPNADCARTAGVAHVTAASDIPTGSEVCINYIDTGRPATSRRQQLAELYKFECACERCVAELSHAHAHGHRGKEAGTGKPAARPHMTPSDVPILFGAITGAARSSVGGGEEGVGLDHASTAQLEGGEAPAKFSYEKSRSTGKAKHAKPKKKFAFDESVLAARKK